ncbi:hypothetical protein OROMI_009301 [Orobanche minor]
MLILSQSLEWHSTSFLADGTSLAYHFSTTTGGSSSVYYNLRGYWNRLKSCSDTKKWSIPFKGSIFASTFFKVLSLANLKCLL